MSVIIQTRGEVGGGVAAHLQCPHCGHYSKSHAHQLSHMAASHPTCLDGVAVGRLGNILMYQSSARLFHCSHCFYTSRDFTKLYKHIISKHCMDEKGGGGGEGGEGGEGGGGERGEGGEGGEGGGEGGEGGGEGGEGGGERGEGGGEGGEGGAGGEAALRRPSGGEGVDDGSDKGDEDEEAGKDAPKRKRSSEAEEEEEGDGLELVEGNKSVLVFDGAVYRCLICGWKNKLKALGVNHVVRKHDIPKAYACQAVRRDAATPLQSQSGGADEEEGSGLSGELLKEEREATAKVVRFISNRFVCLICGWKAKLKGFAISHVGRCHNVERPYSCKDCTLSFFLPSRLQQHVREAHRPGRYACPFCYFRSHFLGGFRRHCSRCNARGGEEGVRGGGGGAIEGMEENEEDEEGEESKEMTVGRKRRRTGKVIEEEEQEDDEDDD